MSSRTAILDGDVLTLDRAHAATRTALARAEDRVIAIRILGWVVSILVDTSHRGGPIRVSELVDLAEQFEVELDLVSVWDGGGSERCEIQIEIDDVTPIEAARLTTIDNPR